MRHPTLALFLTIILSLPLFVSVCDETKEKKPGMDKVIAHRGASFDAPENTEAAIREALQQGSLVIEFDVMASKEGSLYLFHDGSLKRLAARSGKFSDISDAEVKTLDVGRWFPKGNFASETPPSLKAAIEQCLAGGATPLIEHKTGSAIAYAKVLKELDVVDQVIVQSFDWKFLAEIQTELPKLRLGALGKGGASTDVIEKLKTLKPNWVGWKHQDLSAKSIATFKSSNYKVAAYTVNDINRAKELVNLGVDKIITDRPEFIGAGLKE